MSAYENVVVGKLRLKGKALNVRDGSIKKKRKHKGHHVLSSGTSGHDELSDGNNALLTDPNVANEQNEGEKDGDERLTPAERRYLERWREIDLRIIAKATKKSHRDRIQEFNQYLANMTEHYDIPKVGPGRSSFLWCHSFVVKFILSKGAQTNSASFPIPFTLSCHVSFHIP